MADLRARDRVLAELRVARSEFEKGGPAPVAVVDRLVELADALADSGPLELGVSPRRWVRTEKQLSARVAFLQSHPISPLCAPRAKQAIRQLRRLMRLTAWSSRWRHATRGSRWAPFAVFALCAVGLSGLTWLIESVVHGQSSGRWLLPALPIVTIFFFASLSSIWRAREAAVARQLAAAVAPTDRPLAYCRMVSRQFVLATDQRLLGVNLQSTMHSSREQWSIQYAEITAIQPRDKKLGVPMIVRTNRHVQQIAVRELLSNSENSFDYQSYHQEALLRILTRRTRSEPAVASDRTS